MFKWNSAQVIGDLKQIPGIKNVTNSGPGGDVDTDNLQIEVSGSTDDLYVCGFITDSNNSIQNPSDCECEMVELSDGLDSRGGLNSEDFRTSQAYIKVRQYFVSKGVQVINQLKDYF